MKTPITRRNALISGLGALGSGLLGRPQPARAKPSGQAKNLLVVFVQGGWDTTYVLDPKPGLGTVDAPVGQAQKVGGVTIFDHASRPETRAFFQAFGEVSTIVNGIQVQSINHPDCTKRILTGTASELSSDFAAIAAYEHGRALPAPYLAMGASSFPGPLGSISVRTGTATQITTLLDPARAFPAADPEFSPFEPSAAEAELIDAYVSASTERQRATRGALGSNARRLDDFLASRERGERLKGFKQAFPSDFSFALDMNVQIDIALRALDEGLSHSVKLEAAFGGWDTHLGNDLQSALHEELFASLTTLLSELTTRPGKHAGNKLIDETLVAVVSEMGRTPKLNVDLGKDHWPVTSALLLGGGLPGQRVIGRTGDGLEAAPVDFATGATSAGGSLVQYSNFAAAMLEALNVDSAQYLPQSEPFHAITG